MQRFFRKETVKAGDVIVQRGERLKETYWPCTAVISTVVYFEDGSMAEVAITGRFGVLGIEAIIGSDTALHTRIVQIPGDMLVLSYKHFVQFHRESPSFRQMLSHFAQAYVDQIVQVGACNAKHSAKQRAARLLLSFMHASGTTKLPMRVSF